MTAGDEIRGRDEAVSVQRVNQSNWSKAVAAGLPLLAALFAFLGQMPPYPRAAVCAVGIVAGAWVYDRSKGRQSALQLELVKAGASQDSNTVRISPPSTKEG